MFSFAMTAWEIGYFFCSFLVILFVNDTSFLLYNIFSLFPVPGFRVFAIECVREPGNRKKF